MSARATLAPHLRALFPPCERSGTAWIRTLAATEMGCRHGVFGLGSPLRAAVDAFILVAPRVANCLLRQSALTFGAASPFEAKPPPTTENSDDHRKIGMGSVSTDECRTSNGERRDPQIANRVAPPTCHFFGTFNLERIAIFCYNQASASYGTSPSSASIRRLAFPPLDLRPPVFRRPSNSRCPTAPIGCPRLDGFAGPFPRPDAPSRSRFPGTAFDDVIRSGSRNWQSRSVVRQL